MGPFLEPTPAGSALAAALVVAGAPLFSGGLRILRLRRHLAQLAERPLAEVPTGFVMVRGRVALESPLVGPLSGKPCAGYRLEVRNTAVGAVVEERRPFRLVADDVTARVHGAEGTWHTAVTATREVQLGEALTHNLTALIERSPEAALIRRSPLALTLTERALVVGHECWVVGDARQSRPFELPAEIEVARTGTDDRPVEIDARLAPEPDLWIGADGHLDFLRISDEAPDPRALARPLWTAAGLVVGPLVSLAGLLYLAHGVDRLRAAGGS